MDSTISSTNRNGRPFPFSKMDVEQNSKSKPSAQESQVRVASNNTLLASNSSKSSSLESKFTYSPAVLPKDQTQQPQNSDQLNRTIASIILDMIPIMNTLRNAMKLVAESQELMTSISGQLSKLYHELAEAYAKSVDNAELNRQKELKEAAQKVGLFGLLGGIGEILLGIAMVASGNPLGLAFIADGSVKTDASRRLLEDPTLLEKDPSLMDFQKNGLMGVFGEDSDKASTIFQAVLMTASIGISGAQLASAVGSRATATAAAEAATAAAGTAATSSATLAVGGAAASAARTAATETVDTALKAVRWKIVHIINDLISLMGTIYSLSKTNDQDSSGQNQKTAGQVFLDSMTGGLLGLAVAVPFAAAHDAGARVDDTAESITASALPTAINLLFAGRNVGGGLTGKNGVVEALAKYMSTIQTAIATFSSVGLIYSAGHNIFDNIHIRNLTEIQNQATFDTARNAAISSQMESLINLANTQTKDYDKTIQDLAKRLQEFVSVLNSGLENLNPK